jgi:amino acid adenylation domain-containing protein
VIGAADVGEVARQDAIRARCAHPLGGFERFAPDDVDRPVPARFEELVRRHPGRLAIKTPDTTLTYEDVNRGANRIAHALVAGPGDARSPVAILIDNGPSLTVAVMGALKSGRIQVPLDRTYPRHMLVEMLKVAGASAILTDGANGELAAELAKPGGQPVLHVEALDGDDVADLALPLSPGDPVALNFTSGSTGTPKGGVHTHRNLMHVAMRQANTFRLGQHDRYITTQPSTMGPLYALLVGATVCPVDHRVMGMAGMGDWMIATGVTVYRSAVSGLRALLDTLRGDERFPDLRLVLVFGEPAYHGDVERCRRHFDPACIFAASLGTRETADYAYFFADHAGELTPGVIPGGFPSPDLDVLLLDEAGAPVAEGETGELAVRSRYTAVGYWNRPDLTRRSFLPDPTAPDGLIYRTGDLGRRRSDGCLLHLGRKDFQVKIRGHRVDTGDVETALMRIEGVKQAVAAAREDPAGGNRLVAYLVPSGTTLPSIGHMRRTLAAEMPAHMVPTAFVALTELPFTASGKIDRRALPAPAADRPMVETSFSPPAGPVEETLAAIYGRLLGIDQVGADDSFFELGGHSLLALRLVTEIDGAFGRRLPLAVLLEAPSVRALAAIVGRADWTPPWSSLVAIQPRGARVPIYCVPGHSGTILCFQELARQLGVEQPLYGLEPRGLDGRFEPQTSVEEMAAAYVEEIRGFQPTGPYCLAGYCFGGLVAYEMARALREAGETVAVLALFDADAPAAAPESAGPGRRLGRLAAHLRVEYANLAALDTRGRFAYARDRLDRAGGRVAALVGARDTGEDDPLVERVARAQTLAARGYRPGPYEGPMVVYKAQHRLTSHFVDPWFGWRGLVRQGLDVRLIPSRGGSIIQDPDGAAAVAADLARRIPAP